MKDNLFVETLQKSKDLQKERDIITSSKSWGIIIQARIRSSRLHAKILAPIFGMPAIVFLVKRFLHYFDTERVYVALSEEREAELVRLILDDYKMQYITGSSDNVLKRYIECAENFGVTDIVRATADDPLTDMNSTARMLAEHLTLKADYTYIKNLPVGAQEEIVTLKALKISHQKAYKSNHFEHVVDYIHENIDNFNVVTLHAKDWQNRPDVRITMDTPEDYKRIVKIVNFLRENSKQLNLKNVIDAYDRLFLKV